MNFKNKVSNTYFITFFIEILNCDKIFISLAIILIKKFEKMCSKRVEEIVYLTNNFIWLFTNI